MFKNPSKRSVIEPYAIDIARYNKFDDLANPIMPTIRNAMLRSEATTIRLYTHCFQTNDFLSQRHGHR
jgi:hypothetical protein